MTVVASVPHSGSRSLLTYLRSICVEPELSEGPAHIYHFGQFDEEIQSCPFPVHIPVRDPVDVVISWLNRDKNLTELFLAMESMAAYDHPLATKHIVEDLPLIVGAEPATGRVYDRIVVAKTLADNVSSRVLGFYQTYGKR